MLRFGPHGQWSRELVRVNAVLTELKPERVVARLTYPNSRSHEISSDCSRTVMGSFATATVRERPGQHEKRKSGSMPVMPKWMSEKKRAAHLEAVGRVTQNFAQLDLFFHVIAWT
jgi:hypothetical protein